MEEPAVEAPGHPAVVRVRAHNSGPMTLTGTNTYVVGSSPAWVIDPGPADEGHIDLVRRVGETRGGIEGVLLTHSHSDHNAGVGMLGAPLLVGNAEGFDDLAAMLATEPVPHPPAPEDGTEIGPFTVVATPGHAPDHVAFAYGEICFCGDLILGEGSSIVPPQAGGGSLTDYMRSLDRLAELAPALLCPGHGEWISDPAARIAEYAAHRRERERLLLEALAAGKREQEELLDVAWSDVPESMRRAAALAMRAHLEKLGAEGRLPAGW
ncbi:MAG: MBL fold metallo-hydrolase [Solirubrobacterales bacterium]|nr:MBL fold metallo-hydrolase [Solirubrobacterales bacterium]